MTPSVLTVTLNPAIDQTVTVAALRPGTVQQARAVQYNAGGKGINVASCLADWGVSVIATGLLGRDNAAPFDALFSAKNITDRFVRVPGENRVNIKITDIEAGNTTDINLPGLVIGADGFAQVQAILETVAMPGEIAVLAGSLPRGLPADTYAGMVAALEDNTVRVVVDTSGEALNAVLNARVPPYCVKPNRYELEQWSGRALPGQDDLLAAAGELTRRGIAVVVISMGEDGALFRSGNEALCASLPAISAPSTVGAGDAMVAGLVAAIQEGGGLEDIARLATAFAVGKLRRVGPHLPDPDTIRDLAAHVTIRRLSPVQE